MRATGLAGIIALVLGPLTACGAGELSTGADQRWTASDDHDDDDGDDGDHHDDGDGDDDDGGAGNAGAGNAGAGNAGAGNGGANNGCTTCHGFPNASGEHTLHVNKGYKCAECHSSVIDAGNTIIAPALHNNGQRDVKGAFTWNVGPRTCSNGCHGTKAWGAAGNANGGAGAGNGGAGAGNGGAGAGGPGNWAGASPNGGNGGNGAAAMTWWFKDGCDDNQAPTVSLFDKTSGATFGPYPLATFDAAVSAAINCTTGDTICWGGWAASGKTWGCGQNCTAACNDCCFACGAALPTGWSLTCN